MEKFIEYSDKRFCPEIAEKVLERGMRIIAEQEARKAAKQNAGKNAGKEAKTKQNAGKPPKDLTAYFARLTEEIAALEKE